MFLFGVLLAGFTHEPPKTFALDSAALKIEHFPQGSGTELPGHAFPTSPQLMACRNGPGMRLFQALELLLLCTKDSCAGPNCKHEVSSRSICVFEMRRFSTNTQ